MWIPSYLLKPIVWHPFSNRRMNIEQDDHYMRRQRYGYPPSYPISQRNQQQEISKHKSLGSRPGSRGEEIRMKVMNEGQMPHQRYPQQEMGSRGFDGNMIRNQSYNSEFMPRGQSHPSYRSQYEYEMQKRYEMNQYPHKNGSQGMYPNHHQMNKHMYHQPEGVGSSMGSKYTGYMGQDRVMGEYPQRQSQPQYINESSSPKTVISYLKGVLMENPSKYHGLKGIGKEEKRLGLMKKSYIFEKLKLYYESLKNWFEQQKNAIEENLSQPCILEDIKNLAKDDPKNFQLVEAVNDFCKSCRVSDQTNDFYNNNIDDFDSIEEMSKIKSKTSKRKLSDESFSNSPE